MTTTTTAAAVGRVWYRSARAPTASRAAKHRQLLSAANVPEPAPPLQELRGHQHKAFAQTTWEKARHTHAVAVRPLGTRPGATIKPTGVLALPLRRV